MPHRKLIIDFHVHLQDRLTQLALCPEVQRSPFFRHTYPIVERLAHLSEPVHDGLLRHMAMNYNGPISRFIYGRMGKFGLMETLRLFKTYDVRRLIHSMESLNIHHAVIHSIEPLTSTVNVIEMTEEYRDRFSIFASVASDEADPVSYLTPFIEAGSIRGLKIHPIVGGFACGDFFFRTKDLAALALEANIPVLIHTGHIPVDSLKGIGGCNEVTALEPLIAGFPKTKFILAHIGWESWREVLRLGKAYPNVFVETSWQPARVIRRSVDALGAPRVLFGSDFPLFKQQLALNEVRKALSPQEFAQITWGNAVRLLKLETHAGSKSKAS
ncbi:MAG TPA: amidohydrolase family protein [Candidatus Obscuribacterales bacterium]